MWVVGWGGWTEGGREDVALADGLPLCLPPIATYLRGCCCSWCRMAGQRQRCLRSWPVRRGRLEAWKVEAGSSCLMCCRLLVCVCCRSGNDKQTQDGLVQRNAVLWVVYGDMQGLSKWIRWWTL